MNFLVGLLGGIVALFYAAVGFVWQLVSLVVSAVIYIICLPFVIFRIMQINKDIDDK